MLQREGERGGLYRGKGRKCVLSRFDLSTAAAAKKLQAKSIASRHSASTVSLFTIYICPALASLYKAQRKSNVKQWEVNTMKCVKISETELKIKEMQKFLKPRCKRYRGQRCGGECGDAKWRLNVEKWQQS